MFDWLVLGAGFAGSVIAERLASYREDKVLIIDRRPHIGGNAYDRYDRAGVLIHQYGPHIFHTNSRAIFDYLSQFTEWRPYEHRVLAEVDGMQVPIPINLTTVNRLYGLSLTSQELEGWLATRADQLRRSAPPRMSCSAGSGGICTRNFSAATPGSSGGWSPANSTKRLRRGFRRGPTPMTATSATSTSSCRRVGYTKMFERMLDHPISEIMLDTDYREARRRPGIAGSFSPGRSTSISTIAMAGCPIVRCGFTTSPLTRSGINRLR